MLGGQIADAGDIFSSPDVGVGMRTTLQRNSSGGTAAHTRQHGMSRKQQGKQRTGTWTNASMKSAIATVDDNGRLKIVARFFGIPPTSLVDHLYGRILGRKRRPPIVLKQEEETTLTTYITKMQEYGHPLSMQQLRLKVATITHERITPFRKGIPGDSWIRWFKIRHPELTLKTSQGLEFARARGLCPENVASFYKNLEHLYRTHNYPPDNIWNCDESGAQAGRNGGGLVWALRGSRTFHSLMPNEPE
jgi:hypothetical protein